MSKLSKKIVAMDLPKPSMGKQIEYEIYYAKTQQHKHKEVKLSVTLQDSIHWFCRDHEFRVVSVHPDKETPNAPVPLFYRPFSADIHEYSNHVNSGPARSKIPVNQVYKPIFEFEDGTTLDPHIRTT